MSAVCELTGRTVQSGNNVSHSHRKTRRRFMPNLHTVTLRSDILDREYRLKIAARTIRSVDHNGGLDNFLLTAKAASLTEKGAKLRRQIKKAALAQTKAA